ncbi:MAG: barstar family protein [Elusimicrobiales bacterium]|nr:barstar family protein [Elusimicrobiales bacterium]
MDALKLVAGEAPVADARGLSLSPAGAEAALRAAGWLVLRADCAGMEGRDALFSAFAAALGRDYFASNWDAFADALVSLAYDEPSAAGYVLVMESYASLPAGPAVMFEESVKDAAASLMSGHGKALRALLF